VFSPFYEGLQPRHPVARFREIQKCFKSSAGRGHIEDQAGLRMEFGSLHNFAIGGQGKAQIIAFN